MESGEKKNSEKKDIVLRFSNKHVFFGFALLAVVVFLVFAFIFLNQTSFLAPLAILPGSAPAKTVEPPAVSVPEKEVAAIVNGEKIFLAEVNKSFNSLPEQYRAQITKKDILENMIDVKLLLLEGVKNGLTADQNEVEQVFLQQKDAAQKIIDLGEFTEEDIKNSIKDNLIVQKYLGKIVFAKTTATKAEISAFFEQNKEEIKQVSASHILVKTKEEAQDLLNQLNNGADFGELAKEHSIDTVSGEKNGALGFFRKADVVPEFADAAFSLKPGEMSGIVKSQFGFHIILVHEIKDDLESFSEAISQLLIQQKNEQIYKGLVEDLRKNAQIKILFKEN